MIPRRAARTKAPTTAEVVESALKRGLGQRTPFKEYVAVVAAVPGVPADVHAACALAWIEILPPRYDCATELERRLAELLKDCADGACLTVEGRQLVREIEAVRARWNRTSTSFMVERLEPRLDSAESVAMEAGIDVPTFEHGHGIEAATDVSDDAALPRATFTPWLFQTEGRSEARGSVSQLRAVLRDVLKHAPSRALKNAREVFEVLQRLLPAVGAGAKEGSELTRLSLEVSVSRGANQFGYRSLAPKAVATAFGATSRDLAEARARGVVKGLVQRANAMLANDAVFTLPPPRRR